MLNSSSRSQAKTPLRQDLVNQYFNELRQDPSLKGLADEEVYKIAQGRENGEFKRFQDILKMSGQERARAWNNPLSGSQQSSQPTQPTQPKRPKIEQQQKG